MLTQMSSVLWQVKGPPSHRTTSWICGTWSEIGQYTRRRGLDVLQPLGRAGCCRSGGGFLPPLSGVQKEACSCKFVGLLQSHAVIVAMAGPRGLCLNKAGPLTMKSKLSHISLPCHWLAVGEQGWLREDVGDRCS